MVFMPFGVVSVDMVYYFNFLQTMFCALHCSGKAAEHQHTGIHGCK